MKLKEIRKDKKISQKELSETINVSQQNISLWETGKRELRVFYAKKIADALQLKNWWELYEDEEEVKK